MQTTTSQRSVQVGDLVHYTGTAHDDRRQTWKVMSAAFSGLLNLEVHAQLKLLGVHPSHVQVCDKGVSCPCPTGREVTLDEFLVMVHGERWWTR